LAERRLWFVRKNGQVKGPFLTAQISRNILLGRLNSEDEISVDEINWQKIAKHRELYPEVMLQDPVDENQMEIAKIQVDERISEKRRQKQNVAQEMAEERRQTRERRGTEPEVMLRHRENINSLNDTYKKNLKRPKLPTFSIVLLVIVIVVFGFVLSSNSDKGLVDCSVPASAGVNWHNCQFVSLEAENQNLANAVLTDAKFNDAKLMGVNLTGSDMAYSEVKQSDLSYANLEGVRLIGANLSNTDLRYANLKNADLSYADLTGALLAGANMNNVQLGNTIWIDGQVCKKGSVGSCQ
jgi:uncharacterized protein YjbI with pentapeptide repeats